MKTLSLKYSKNLRSEDGNGVHQEDSTIDDHQGTGSQGITFAFLEQKFRSIVPLVDNQGTRDDEQHATNDGE